VGRRQRGRRKADDPVAGCRWTGGAGWLRLGPPLLGSRAGTAGRITLLL